MKLLLTVLVALFISIAAASPFTEVKRSLGGCSVPQGTGFCGSIRGNDCPGGTFYPGSAPNWPCPGNNDIQCCIVDCYVPEVGGGGYCGSKSSGGCPGRFEAGSGPNWPCPGDDDIQCCVWWWNT